MTDDAQKPVIAEELYDAVLLAAADNDWELEEDDVNLFHLIERTSRAEALRLREESASLCEQVARLSAPVSDERVFPLCKCGGIAVFNASGNITRTCIRCGAIVRAAEPAKEQS